CHECRYELGRQDQVAKPERGKEELGKRAHVDDASGAIEALDRRDRVTLESVLAVVVVLDHEGAAALGPVEQRQATLEGQERAGRKLMGRRDIDEACPIGPSA